MRARSTSSTTRWRAAPVPSASARCWTTPIASSPRACFARVQLLGSGQFQALLIDDKAVLTDQDRKYVYVVDKDGKAQRRDIQLGRTAEGLRIVEHGLAAGDKVIIDGVQKVFMPGMPVQAKAVAMQPHAAPAPGRDATAALNH